MGKLKILIMVKKSIKKNILTETQNGFRRMDIQETLMVNHKNLINKLQSQGYYARTDIIAKFLTGKIDTLIMQKN